MDRGANQVVMGEREIASSMLNVLKKEIAVEPISRECPI
jgi:CPA2 family monovalent cation:H+ antiporter-2